MLLFEIFQVHILLYISYPNLRPPHYGFFKVFATKHQISDLLLRAGLLFTSVITSPNCFVFTMTRFILYILTLIYIYSKTTWVLWKNNLQASWDLVYVKIVCFVSFCASMPWQTWIQMQFFHRSCGIKKFVISIYFVWMFHDKHELRWRISTAMLKGNIILMCHKSNYGHGKYFDFSFVRYRKTTKSFFCSQNLAAFPIT